jgi:hypothetical protein
MATGELRSTAMALTADEILEHVRALPPRERLKLVERVVHEAAEAAERPALLTDGPPLWEDVSDEEFEKFQENLRKNRREDVLRTP